MQVKPFGILRITEQGEAVIGTWEKSMERDLWLQFHRDNTSRFDTNVQYAAFSLELDPFLSRTPKKG
jgi:hypothetical protein